jgi:hypothetical protein
MTFIKPFIHWGFLFIQLITAALAVCTWNKSKSVVWKAFISIWVLTFLIEAIGKIMGSYGINNLWLYNSFFPLFFPSIILLYFDVFAKRKLQWLAVIAAVGLFLWAVIYLMSGRHLVLNTYFVIIASVFIIFFALTYLIRLFLDSEITSPLRNDFYYWFSTGFIIYFVFNAIMLGMYTRITESKNTWLPIFTFYSGHLITLVLHICLWAGFRAALKWMK